MGDLWVAGSFSSSLCALTKRREEPTWMLHTPSHVRRSPIKRLRSRNPQSPGPPSLPARPLRYRSVSFFLYWDQGWDWPHSAFRSQRCVAWQSGGPSHRLDCCRAVALCGLRRLCDRRLRTRWVGTHTHEVFFRDTAHGEGRGEVTRILANGLSTGGVPDTDRRYLASLIAARTGISQADAQKRVDDVVVRARQEAEAARKAAATTSLLTALAMMIGAFVACAAAALGGHERDRHPGMRSKLRPECF
jgi:hypothetical protein